MSRRNQKLVFKFKLYFQEKIDRKVSTGNETSPKPRMPLYPHSILKKPKDLKVDVSGVKTNDVDVDDANDICDRPTAQPGVTLRVLRNH